MADDVIDALAKLKPAAPDRDAILFAAGRASARRGPWRLLLVGLVIQQAVLISIWISPKERGSVLPGMPLPIGPPVDVDPQPVIPESPSVAPRGSGPSLLDLDPQSPDPIPGASIIPEQHWTIRTSFSDL